MERQRLSFGPFLLDLERENLSRDGAPVAIGTRALALLRVLVGAGNRAVPKADLIDAAWPGAAIEESNLSVQVANLRKALGTMPGGGEWIATVPRVGYRFAGEISRSVPAGISPAARPTVLVQSFVDVTGEEKGDLLASGLTEDVVAALSRFRWFGVTRQGTDAPYVLSASVRKSGARVRISAQLVAAATGTHVWAEKYDIEATDLFAIQDELAARVAGAIEPELLRSESGRLEGDRSARDLVRQGTLLFHRLSRETHLEARALFREARRLDPTLVEAHIWLARVTGGILAYGWSSDTSEDAAEGLEAALTSIRLDEQNPYAHYGLAIVSIYAGNLERGRRAAERAVEANASFALGHLVLGMALLFQGDAGSANGPLERGLELSPHDPQNFIWLNLLALARALSGDASAGLEVAQRVVKVRPDWRPGFETLAYCQALLGRRNDARLSAKHLRELDQVPGDALAPLRSRNPAWTAKIAETIRKLQGAASAAD
jgi:TolB-like protein